MHRDSRNKGCSLESVITMASGAGPRKFADNDDERSVIVVSQYRLDTPVGIMFIHRPISGTSVVTSLASLVCFFQLGLSSEVI